MPESTLKYDLLIYHRTSWLDDTLSGLVLDGVEPEAICIKWVEETPLIIVSGVPRYLFKESLVRPVL